MAGRLFPNAQNCLDRAERNRFPIRRESGQDDRMPDLPISVSIETFHRRLASMQPPLAPRLYHAPSTTNSLRPLRNASWGPLAFVRSTLPAAGENDHGNVSKHATLSPVRCIQTTAAGRCGERYRLTRPNVQMKDADPPPSRPLAGQHHIPVEVAPRQQRSALLWCVLKGGRRTLTVRRRLATVLPATKAALTGA